MTEAINSSTKVRVACFIDGFNLYHAIDDLGKNHLKWVDLRALMECFIDKAHHEIVAIYYFTAIAEWLPGPAARHKKYIAALQARNVTPVLGSFKRKNASCNHCKRSWIGHEEKQTDVNIAISFVREAFHDKYDEAFLVTRDSDLVPAVKLVNEMRKERKIKLIAPPGLRHSKELLQLSQKNATIKEIHLERSLLTKDVKSANGSTAATRPKQYDPPILLSTPT